MILYLETSNLVKLYVEEPDSEDIKIRVAESDVVATSLVSYVEARAALARKFREKGLTARDYESIKSDLSSDWDSLFVLNLTNALAKIAGNLAEKHGLRGYDSIHLASALELKKVITSAILFSSSDATLSEAARTEGLG
jgi:predicted nucleic acid-binding protein